MIGNNVVYHEYESKNVDNLERLFEVAYFLRFPLFWINLITQLHE